MMRNIVFSLLLMLGLQSCASVPGVVEPPKISVQNVALQNLSLNQGTAVIQLQLTNPNAFPLPLRGIQYGLSLNGRSVASGQQVQERNINANETVALAIPVQMNLSELFRLVPSLMRQRQVDYNLQGAVDLPFISVPFSRQGGVGVSL